MVDSCSLGGLRGVCVILIGVVSVYMVYNYVYYCDTCYIQLFPRGSERNGLGLGMCMCVYYNRRR
jgi:hypothetical protein